MRPCLTDEVGRPEACEDGRTGLYFYRFFHRNFYRTGGNGVEAVGM